MPSGRIPLGDKRLFTHRSIHFKEPVNLKIEQLNKIAAELGTNKSDLIRKALFEYLENHKIEIPSVIDRI